MIKSPQVSAKPVIALSILDKSSETCIQFTIRHRKQYKLLNGPVEPVNIPVCQQPQIIFIIVPDIIAGGERFSVTVFCKFLNFTATGRDHKNGCRYKRAG